MKILYVAAEAAPFAKTGGLADVALSLPKALRKMDLDVRVIMPKYKNISQEFVEKMEFIEDTEIMVGGNLQYCGILSKDYQGVSFYFVDNENYFKRDNIYGYSDDGERYSFFCKSVLEVMKHIDFFPDVIHCNDWHTGMIFPLMDGHYKEDCRYNQIKKIFTIHNLQYQGVFPKGVLDSCLNLGWDYFAEDKLEFYGNINFMKAGINYSDFITTVSETYAQEIQYPYFGENLDGLLRHHRNRLQGIVNGIDYDIYNPQTDPKIYKNYKWSLKCKEENKIALQKELNLPQNREVPVISMVTRIVSQKGIDLVLEVLEELLQEDLQVIILGTGDQEYQQVLMELSRKYPEKFSANIRFSEDLSRRIYAGSDLFLMPSKFEPCGLGQLIALRYGTIPIVRETGGLKNTIRPYNELTNEGNGFTFTNFNAHDMLYVIKMAVNMYRDKEKWRKIVKNASTSDYSWDSSAIEYQKLYQRLVDQEHLEDP